MCDPPGVVGVEPMQCRPRSAATTFGRVVLAGASTPAWCLVYRLRERPKLQVNRRGKPWYSVSLGKGDVERIRHQKLRCPSAERAVEQISLHFHLYQLLPKLGWQIFIQGGLPLAFGSKAKQWSISIYRYLTPALQSDCIADRSVAENYLRLVINARRLL